MSKDYIGSRISVTTTSKVRYEGILALVDPNEGTITVNNGT